MNSRERLLAALRRQPVDHIPLLLRFWPLGTAVDNIPFEWKDELQRVENTLALGLDDTLLVQPPCGYVEEYHPEGLPGVESQVELLPEVHGEKYPLLNKMYRTPDGSLQTTIRLTEDWPCGWEIHLFDDHNVSRLKEPLIKSKEDLPALRWLLGEPGEPEQQAFHERAALLQQVGQRLGILLDGGWSALGDSVVWLVGMERVLYGQMDEPEFLDAVLEVIFEWEQRRMEQVLAEGVDAWVHMAWYEGCDFWTPKSFRRLLKPRLQKLAAKAHSHNVPFRYIITKGWRPLLDDLLELGIDCLAGIDPVQDRLDLAEVKQAAGGRLCLMGGVNSGIMLSDWDEAAIRRAVRQAIETLAPGGGFILYPVDAVFDVQSWEKVQALIDEWRLCIEI